MLVMSAVIRTALFPPPYRLSLLLLALLMGCSNSSQGLRVGKEREHAEREPQAEASALSELSSPKEEQPANSPSGRPLRISHYLYFPSVEQGKAVAALLRERGFTVEDRKSVDGVNWLVLAKHSLPPEDEAGLAIREELERLAQQHAGEYDGSETALSE